MADVLAPPQSPCIKNCTLDADGYCQGCYRTIEEIACWSGMTHVEQRALLLSLKERARRMAYGGKS
jgi:hypothetical protein